MVTRETAEITGKGRLPEFEMFFLTRQENQMSIYLRSTAFPCGTVLFRFTVYQGLVSS